MAHRNPAGFTMARMGEVSPSTCPMIAGNRVPRGGGHCHTACRHAATVVSNHTTRAVSHQIAWPRGDRVIRLGSGRKEARDHLEIVADAVVDLPTGQNSGPTRVETGGQRGFLRPLNGAFDPGEVGETG